MSELAVALVGCGPMGQVHLRCWSVLTGVRIAAVFDPDGGVAARTAASYPGCNAFVDFQEMMRSEPFDVVDVCGVLAERATHIATALRSGSNVLCDRFLAPTSATAQELVTLANDRERLLMPGLFHRFHGSALFAKELIENFDIGKPTSFRFRLSGVRGEQESATGWAEWNASAPVYETAIHGLDLFRYLCGEIADVHCEISRSIPTNPTADTATMLLRGETGTLGTVEIGWNTPGGQSVLELYGTAGACMIDYLEGTTRYLTADHPVWQHYEDNGPNRYERGIAQFADTVRGLQTVEISGADGVRALELCERASAGTKA